MRDQGLFRKDGKRRGMLGGDLGGDQGILYKKVRSSTSLSLPGNTDVSHRGFQNWNRMYGECIGVNESSVNSS